MNKEHFTIIKEVLDSVAFLEELSKHWSKEEKEKLQKLLDNGLQ